MRSLGVLLMFAMLSVSASLAMVQEMELRGKVTRVDGSIVRIEMESESWPRVGDKVRLAQTMPGYDDLIFMRGEWTVVEVTTEYVQAEPGPDAMGAPGEDYVAVILSANPQPPPDSGGGGPPPEETGGGGGGAQGGVFGLEDEGREMDLDEAARMYDALLAYMGDASPTQQEYFERARAGDPDAQNQVGVYYNNGDGVPQSYEEAAKWYRLAAEQDHLWAMTNLGSLYKYGRGVPQDYTRAVEYYRRAADQGFAVGQRNLATMYHSGNGVQQDYGEAVRLYRLAAAQDYAAAHNDLGIMYEEGLGVPQDYAQAMTWYRSAAELGESWGYLNVAQLYERGQGVPADRSLAIQNYQAAARLGNTNAQEWLRERGLNW
jgi:hypothetical protein